MLDRKKTYQHLENLFNNKKQTSERAVPIVTKTNFKAAEEDIRNGQIRKG